MFQVEWRPATRSVSSESLNDILYSETDILQAFDRRKGRASLPSDAYKKARQVLQLFYY